MISAGSLRRRVAAMEERTGKQPERIFICRGLTRAEDEALTQHFGGKRQRSARRW